MQRVRIGVVGAGAIAQIEHVPNLLKLKPQFEILGVCDPSAAARAFIGEHFGIAAFASFEDLLELPLDAVAIASPDPLHHEQILAALGRGLHVFCEKPLCYSAADIDDLIAARDRAGKVLQVGYMKRFDPSYEAALARMPGTARTLRYLSVEVNDPDAWPFIRHHAWRRSEDVAADVKASVLTKQKQQVSRAVPVPLNAPAYRGFVGAYCSSLVHDVNAVHGLLDALGVPAGEIAGAQLFANGDGGQGTVRLLGGQALWNMVHVAVPEFAEYRERITLYFDAASLELEFPAPWLNHQPTRLQIKTSDGHRLVSADVRSGYEEAFIEELKGFWSAIAEAAPVRNTAEQARRDMRLLCGLAHWHATHQPHPKSEGVRR
jgi:predicted dehydrogenase